MRGAQALVQMRIPYLENHAAIADSQALHMIKTAALKAEAQDDDLRSRHGIRSVLDRRLSGVLGCG